MFIGDQFYQGAYHPDWDWRGVDALVGAYRGNNHPVRGVLRESGHPTGAGAAGRACLETGVMDLWIQGLATNPRRLTRFLNPWDYPVSLEQRLMVFAPACGSLGYWNWDGPEVLREMMFPSYFGGETLVAGAVGCITAGFRLQHGLYRDLLLYEICRAAPGTPYAEVVGRVADTLYEIDPDYARGLLAIGGIVKYPGGMGLSAVAEQADRPGTVLRWVRGSSAIGRFEYALDGAWQVKLEVFDIQGRRVSQVDEAVRTGRVATPWSPDELASGLYFARLEAHRGSERRSWTTKVNRSGFSGELIP